MTPESTHESLLKHVSGCPGFFLRVPCASVEIRREGGVALDLLDLLPNTVASRSCARDKGFRVIFH